MYWVDDIFSDDYNELIKTSIKPMFSAEHLIDYANDAYEYAIEIKTNPDNIKGKGSAIFLHCKRKEYTAGCIAIDSEDMKILISMIDSNTKIKIIDLDE
jgi:L,D-peptidoglycan transpeptidase YkuD (ErfK/YbiS/YcfS/YnhG family)